MRMDIYSVGYGREKDKREKNRERGKEWGKKWLEERDRNCLFGIEMERPVVDFFLLRFS